MRAASSPPNNTSAITRRASFTSTRFAFDRGGEEGGERGARVFPTIKRTRNNKKNNPMQFHVWWYSPPTLLCLPKQLSEDLIAGVYSLGGGGASQKRSQTLTEASHLSTNCFSPPKPRGDAHRACEDARGKKQQQRSGATINRVFDTTNRLRLVGDAPEVPSSSAPRVTRGVGSNTVGSASSHLLEGSRHINLSKHLGEKNDTLQAL